MATIPPAQPRSSPSHLKKAATRPYRPTAVPRTASSPKLATRTVKWKTNAVHEGPVDANQNDDDMATSFLPYWYAMGPDESCSRVLPTDRV